jgi:hypothetical protein
MWNLRNSTASNASEKHKWFESYCESCLPTILVFKQDSCLVAPITRFSQLDLFFSLLFYFIYLLQCSTILEKGNPLLKCRSTSSGSICITWVQT